MSFYSPPQTRAERFPEAQLNDVERQVWAICQQALEDAQQSALMHYTRWRHVDVEQECWVDMYLRIQRLKLGDTVVQALTLANIEVHRPGQGVGSVVARTLLSFASQHGLSFYIENVFQEGFMPCIVTKLALTKREEHDPITPSYYWFNPASERAMSR